MTTSTEVDSPTPSKTTLLEMRAITKRFPGVLALSDVSFTVGQGEVVALVGENGAGKSTSMKIISGVYTADAGEIIYKGKPVTFTNPRQAQAAGIATIYQELNQVPQLSITENIFLGSEITRGPVIDWAEMHRQARQLLAKLRLDIDPRTNLGKLGGGEQQMVEVAKALHHRADLIIMDEPTSALSIREIHDLFAITRELKANGVSIIYISHHLDEAFEVSDRITVLCDGHHMQSGAYQNGTNMTLISVVAVVIGGTALSGGIGGIWGTLVGVFIIRVVDAGLVYLDVPSNAKEIVIGVIIVLAVALDVIRRGEITWLRLPGMRSSKS